MKRNIIQFLEGFFYVLSISDQLKTEHVLTESIFLKSLVNVSFNKNHCGFFLLVCLIFVTIKSDELIKVVKSIMNQ